MVLALIRSPEILIAVISKWRRVLFHGSIVGFRLAIGTEVSHRKSQDYQNRNKVDYDQYLPTSWDNIWIYHESKYGIAGWMSSDCSHTDVSGPKNEVASKKVWSFSRSYSAGSLERTCFIPRNHKKQMLTPLCKVWGLFLYNIDLATTNLATSNILSN